MGVRKLFYEDSHLKRFRATVTDCRQTSKGWEVELDATAFYPEGGGQACDLGALGNACVLDVREAGERIVHLCDQPLPVGEQVEGCVDWQRRFDLMQQHSGEHILSGLIHAAFGYHNVGFHIGSQVMEVDFDGPISPEKLMELERKANEAVWQDLPILCWYPSQEELPTVNYRRKKDIPWPVRIVQVPGFDTCACCGVHVERTGQVGLIKVLSCTKFHSGVRLEMVCGERAYDYVSGVWEQNKQVSQLLSAKVLETGAAAARLAEQLSAEKYRAAGLEKKLFAAIAEACAQKGSGIYFAQALSATGVRELADTIAAGIGTAAVFSGNDSDGYSLCLCGEVSALGQKLKEELGARGGGKPGYFQGSVKATRGQIEEIIKELG